jgi:hypothetical protein
MNEYLKPWWKRIPPPAFPILAVLSLGAALGACAGGLSESDQLATAVAATETARAMEASLQTSIAETVIATVEVTSTPTETPIPPSVTPTATATATPTPSPTVIPVPANWVAFIKDVTIPDGTQMDPDEGFTKIWRLENVGLDTWTTDYALVFVSGYRMGAPKEIHLSSSVRPGETIDLAVDMVAPLEPGRYRGYWELQNAAGKRFGLGPDADAAFWVDIRVVKVLTHEVYDFDAHYCDAQWSSGAGSLECPGDTSQEEGSVVLLHDPKMEDGRTHLGNALLTTPQKVDRGYIQGVFPAFKVKDGDHFQAQLSCPPDIDNCLVNFLLQYQTDDGQVKELQSWKEANDGLISRADVDLSSLAGKKVKFILTLRAGRDYEKGEGGLWLNPGIWR